MKIHGYRKLNYIFNIKQLGGKIEPEQSKYLVKTNMITITLIKTDSKKWGDLKYKEDRFNKKE